MREDQEKASAGAKALGLGGGAELVQVRDDGS